MSADKVAIQRTSDPDADCPSLTPKLPKLIEWIYVTLSTLSFLGVSFSRKRYPGKTHMKNPRIKKTSSEFTQT